MNSKKLAISLCTAAFAGYAGADIIIPFGAPEFGWSEAGKFSGNASVGYGTKYISRGLALDNSGTDNPVSFQGLGQYTLGNNNSIVGGLRVDWLADKGFHHHATGNPFCDEGTGLLQFAHRYSKGTAIAFGYQFVHGGMPGCINYHAYDATHHDFPFFDHDRPEEHSLVLDFHHEFTKGLEGFFWDSRVQYSFRWVDGWWFINTLGYQHSVSDRLRVVATATWNASINYYDSHMLNANGTQGYELKVAAPYKLTEKITLNPYVSGVFIGNGGKAADGWGGESYRDFTFAAGVSLIYSF